MIQPNERVRPDGSRAIALTCVVALAAGGCGVDESLSWTERPAVELWSQPEGLRTVFQPQDVEAVGRTSAWVADAGFGVVTRISAVPRENGMFGRQDQEPTEVVQPVRVAAAPDIGVFAYDIRRRMIDLFTEDGQLLWSFDPGLVPSVMDVVRSPLGLVFASLNKQDSVTTLLVTRSDLRGEQHDTLLSPTIGPPSLRAIPPAPAHTSIVPSDRGFWIWSRSMPDTVFEVSASSQGRKLFLGPGLEDAAGMLSDNQKEVLWIVRPDTVGLRYVGFAVHGAGAEVYTPSHVATRTTPAQFAPQTAFDGAVLGWTETSKTRFRLTSYDMALPSESTP